MRASLPPRLHFHLLKTLPAILILQKESNEYDHLLSCIVRFIMVGEVFEEYFLSLIVFFKKGIVNCYKINMIRIESIRINACISKSFIVH